MATNRKDPAAFGKNDESSGERAERGLLILDLDETLINGCQQSLSRPADFHAGPFCVYKRPHVDRFLVECSRLFELAVWSSAGEGYVDEIVCKLFPNPETLKFVWSRSSCIFRRDLEAHSDVWLKDLKKVKRRGFRLERTIVIDDSPEKLSRHYGNLVRVSPDEGNLADCELETLIPFLTWLATADNVRRVEKRSWRSFGREPSRGA